MQTDNEEVASDRSSGSSASKLIVTLGNQDRFQNSEVQLRKLILSGKVAFPVIILIGCCLLYFLYI